jgi:hypothetical protein
MLEVVALQGERIPQGINAPHVAERSGRQPRPLDNARPEAPRYSPWVVI